MVFNFHNLCSQCLVENTENCYNKKRQSPKLCSELHSSLHELPYVLMMTWQADLALQ